MGVTNRVLLGGVFAKEEAKYPWVASCNEPGCYFIVSARSEKQGEQSLGQHKCPYGGNERGYEHGIMRAGRNLHEGVWDLLDSVTDGLMLAKADVGQVSAEKVDFLKGRASGLASVIMFIATPYFDTVQDVSRWALERYKMRTGQREHEPTVGCEGYDPLRGEPSPQWVTKVSELRRTAAPEKTAFRGADVTANMPRQRKAVATKPEKLLSPEEIEGVKNALLIGVLDDATIIDMFKISPAQLEAMKVESTA
jgi:hypothetical protein